MKSSLQTPKTPHIKRPKRHETKLKSSTVGVSLDSILLTYAAEFSIRTIPNSSTNMKECVPSVNKETSVIIMFNAMASKSMDYDLHNASCYYVQLFITPSLLKCIPNFHYLYFLSYTIVPLFIFFELFFKLFSLV